MYVGTNAKRVDAYDKATGRAKFTDDLCPQDALVAKILHATIAHGTVKSMDISKAEAIEGVVKVVTCFDAPNRPFATDGHPWHLHESMPHANMDRLLLNQKVRLYGDEIAAVVAENEVIAKQALAAIVVEYEELPFVLDSRKALSPEAAQLHKDKEGNLCGETHLGFGDYEAVIQNPDLICFDQWYHTPVVQHCHMENHICYAYQESGKMVVYASTQIPHIIRRIVAQALGLGWGKVRVVKPYIGGGFGNKQDALYEPLCAWLSTLVGGRCVKLDCTREETFVSNRVRHGFDMHLITHVRPDGTVVARAMEAWSKQGAYTSHGHGIMENALGAFLNLYTCQAAKADGYTAYTNTPSGGAMRGYGFPQVMYALECQMEEIAQKLSIDSIELRKKNWMPVGFVDDFTKNENYYDSLRLCVEKGKAQFDWDGKKAKYQGETGDVRHGVGMAIFWYTAGVWPVAVETASCRMVLNQDGSIQLQMPETEIGQGADTAFAQMAADSLGFSMEQIHVVTNQDTDVTPFGLGAYASRQTYVASFSIRQTAQVLRQRILDYAAELTRQPAYQLDIQDDKILRISDGRILLTTEELATTALYSQEHSVHITAETTADVKNNAFHFGCSFAEVEVDIPLCKVKLLSICNVHDAGTLINPQLAEAQVHGGMSMAIGFGLSEQLLFDEKTGKPLNNNFLDYKLSTAMDHPNLDVAFVETVEPTSGFGNRSLGEPPACSGAPAIANAILDATGVPLHQIPMTPHVLFTAFRNAGLI